MIGLRLVRYSWADSRLRQECKQQQSEFAHMEIELKLLVDPAHVNALRSHPLLQECAVEKPHEQKLVSTYYDTPDLQVRKCDAALRVRKAGRRWMQALKGGGHVAAGLHSRNEWEGRVAGPALDPAALQDMVDADSDWGRLVRDDDLMGSLIPVFTTRVTRTIWELRLSDGTEIECALDRGMIEHADRKTRVSELELELKSGEPQRLFGFALQLLDRVPLRIGNVSKAERGYALYAPQTPQSVTAAPLELSPCMTVEQGFQAIAAGCIAHVQGNETGVADGCDPESVHQMRVGLRRLRSAFKLFKEVLPLPDAMVDEFGWLAAQLGAARDWDVLSASTLAAVARTAPPEAGVAALQQAATDIAAIRHEQAVAAVVSVRHTRLMLGFVHWLQGASWRDAMSEKQRKQLDAPLKTFADHTLVKDQRRLLKRGKHLRRADVQARHRLRIAAKRARYTAEFFQSLYPAKRVRRYVRMLSALQDELGWLNDVAVAEGLLQELQEQQEGWAAAAGFARGYLAYSVLHDDQRLHQLWKRFKPVGLPCRKTA